MKHFYYTKISIIIIPLLSIIILLYAKTSPGSPAHSVPAGSSQRPSGSPAGLKKFRVALVHDGDTVSIRVSGFAGLPIRTERVRLIGIDAPELKQEQWGRKAKRYLKKLVSESDWVVEIEFDVEQRDKHGRLLAYLWGKDGRMINERMVEAGYALPYTVPPNVKYADKFIAAQKRARQSRAGIWGKGGLKQSPGEWRRRHPRM